MPKDRLGRDRYKMIIRAFSFSPLSSKVMYIILVFLSIA